MRSAVVLCSSVFVLFVSGSAYRLLCVFAVLLARVRSSNCLSIAAPNCAAVQDASSSCSAAIRVHPERPGGERGGGERGHAHRYAAALALSRSRGHFICRWGKLGSDQFSILVHYRSAVSNVWLCRQAAITAGLKKFRDADIRRVLEQLEQQRANQDTPDTPPAALVASPATSPTASPLTTTAPAEVNQEVVIIESSSEEEEYGEEEVRSSQLQPVPPPSASNIVPASEPKHFVGTFLHKLVTLAHPVAQSTRCPSKAVCSRFVTV